MLMVTVRSHKSDYHLKRKILVCAGTTVMFGTLSVVGLVQNGRGAVERYDRLISTDKAGGDVSTALNELRTYIYSHMNAEIGNPNGIYPPIQLSGTYERLVEAEEQRVKTSNDELYSEAQGHCEENGPQGFSGGNRLSCINAYVDENGAKVQQIDDSLYKFDFVAPRWSPDLSGISIVLAMLSVLPTLYYLLAYLHTKHLVRSGN